MLPVIDPAQLQVILLFNSSPSNNDLVTTIVNQNCIQTRLQIGAITRMSYVGYLASLPQSSSLQLEDFYTDDSSSKLSEHLFGGFSFLADITNSEEPKNIQSCIK